MRSHSLLLVTLAALSGFALGACRVSRDNPEHCFYAHGNETCAELDPSRPFCAPPTCSLEPYGCVAELPTETSCQSPCGGAQTAQDDSSCIEVAADSGTEGEPEPDLPEEPTDECHFHADCPPEAAFCFFGTCTPCNGTSDPDSACHVLTDGQAPICLDGECVQCTQADVDECIETSLACDTLTHTCAPCTAHDQCPGGAACDLPLGTCLPADAVWHIDGDGGQDFMTVAAALEELDGGSGTLIVHSWEEESLYLDSVQIDGDRAVALFGADGDLPLFFSDGIDVSGGARMYVRRIMLAGATPVNVAGQESYLELDSSVFTASQGDALFVNSGVLHMRNSMLVSYDDDSVPLRLFGHSKANVVYSTLIMVGADPAVSCAISPGIGSSIRNSVLLNEQEGPAIDCGTLYSNNVVDEPRPNNTSVGDLDMTWFSWSEFPGNAHLTNLAPVSFASAAIWQVGDPTVDFDGDPRPTQAGSPDFAGADRLP